MRLDAVLALARRFLALAGGGFDLGVVVVEDPQDQARVAEALAALAGARARPAEALAPDPREALAAAPPQGALVVWGFGARHAELARRLNVQRDALVREVAVPWLFVATRAAARMLADEAGDLLDFASFHATVEAEGEGAVPVGVGLAPLAPAEPLTGRALFDRLWLGGRWDELERRASDARVRDPGDVDALIVLGRVREARGDPGAAERYRYQAAAAARRSGDPRRTIRVWEEVLRAWLALPTPAADPAWMRREFDAVVAFARAAPAPSGASAITWLARKVFLQGRPDAAEALLDLALPLLEGAPDPRRQADGRVARVDGLLVAGRAEAATALLREAVLPVFEAAGDRRQSAMARLRLAAAEVVAGRLEDAERRLADEVLPAFAALGDVPGRVGAEGWLDLVRARLGRPGAAPGAAWERFTTAWAARLPANFALWTAALAAARPDGGDIREVSALAGVPALSGDAALVRLLRDLASPGAEE